MPKAKQHSSFSNLHSLAGTVIGLSLAMGTGTALSADTYTSRAMAASAIAPFSSARSINLRLDSTTAGQAERAINDEPGSPVENFQARFAAVYPASFRIYKSLSQIDQASVIEVYELTGSDEETRAIIELLFKDARRSS